MFLSSCLLCFCVSSLSVITSSQRLNSSLPQKDFEYRLPDGYSIERVAGTGKVDERQVYGAVLVAKLELAYEDFQNLADPVSYPYPAITLNITGVDDTSPYYRQFASYNLYHAL